MRNIVPNLKTKRDYDDFGTMLASAALGEKHIELDFDGLEYLCPTLVYTISAFELDVDVDSAAIATRINCSEFISLMLDSTYLLSKAFETYPKFRDRWRNDVSTTTNTDSGYKKLSIIKRGESET